MNNLLNPFSILSNAVKSNSILEKFELLTPLKSVKFYPPLMTGLQYLNNKMKSSGCSDFEIIESMNLLLIEFIELLKESESKMT